VEEGIEFVTGVASARTYGREAHGDFDASSWRPVTVPRDLKVEGGSWRRPFRHGLPGRQHEESARGAASPISAAGKNVVVIGGGDTAPTASARRSPRAQERHQLEILLAAGDPPRTTRGRSGPRSTS